MQRSYMERSNALATGKRILDSNGTEEDQRERKRPALARFVLHFFIKYLYLCLSCVGKSSLCLSFHSWTVNSVER